MATQFIDIVIEGGDLVRVECPGKFYDEIINTLDNCRRRGSWLSSSMYDGLSFEYLGHRIDSLNCNKIVALL